MGNIRYKIDGRQLIMAINAYVYMMRLPSTRPDKWNSKLDIPSAALPQLDSNYCHDGRNFDYRNFFFHITAKWPASCKQWRKPEYQANTKPQVTGSPCVHVLARNRTWQWYLERHITKYLTFIINDATWLKTIQVYFIIYSKQCNMAKTHQPACENAPTCINIIRPGVEEWIMVRFRHVGALCMQVESLSVRLHVFFKYWIFGHMAFHRDTRRLAVGSSDLYRLPVLKGGPTRSVFNNRNHWILYCHL